MLLQPKDDAAHAQMESLGKLESLLASAPLGVAFLDRDLRVERVNDALARVLGAPASQCEGRTVADLVPNLADVLLPMLRQVTDSGEAMPDLEFSGQAPGTGGRTRHWLAAFFPVRTKSGDMTGVGIILRDITARKEIANLDRRRARHREALHELAASLVATVTSEEVVAAVVAHAANAFGAVGSVIVRREAPLVPLPTDAPLAHVARTGEPLFLESAQDWARLFPDLPSLADGGGVGHHAVAVVPLAIDGRPMGALGIAFDTARTFDAEERAVAVNVARQCALALERARLLEAERTARAEADAASQVKTQFLATMSHELRTPLNAIGGYAELLEMGIHGPVTPPQREILSRIQRSQRHLLGLINNVLNLVKLDTGHERFIITDVPLEPVLTFVAEATLPLREVRHLRFTQAPCPGVTVRADEEKLKQILLNLMSNAIKFTDDGGAIGAEYVPSGTGHGGGGRGEAGGGGGISVEVHDTGSGIAADQLDRIFDPFVQVDRRLNRPIEGTGLGLAISRELARGMGGDLTVRSTPGTGSVFSLRLRTE